MIRHAVRYGLLASVLGVLAATPASADLLGPSAYLCFDRTAVSGCGTADSPFAASVANGDFSGGYFHLETFEDHLFNTPGISANTGFVTSESPAFATIHDSVDADDGSIDGSGLAGDSYFASLSVTFTFDEAALGDLPTSVGLVWTDGANPVTFTAYDETGTVIETIVTNIADASIVGETAEDRFFGVTHAAGIWKLTVSDPAGIEVDHIQYGFARTVPTGVPEPATLAVLGFGLAGLAWARRKRAV